MFECYVSAFAPGLPPPGQAIQDCAKLLASAHPGKSERWLIEYVQGHVLYSRGGFFLSLPLNGKQVIYNVLSGHIWARPDLIGPRLAKVAVVGKRPGLEEMTHLANFVGPSGKLLRQVLKDKGIPETEQDSFYVTNLIKWYEPAVDNIPPEWRAVAVPILFQELAIVKPDYILALGLEAAQVVLGQRISLKLASNKVHTIQLPVGDGTKEVLVFVTRHPAQVCRSPEALPLLQSELELFCSKLADRKPVIVNDQVQIDVIATEEDLERVRKEVMSLPPVRRVSVDLEWNQAFPCQKGAYVRTAQIAWKPYHAAVIVVRRQGGAEVRPGWQEKCARVLKEILLDPQTQVIGAHISADYPWLKHLGIDLLAGRKIVPDDAKDPVYPGIFDIAVAEHAMNEVGPFDLESLAIGRCGFRPWSQDLERWISAHIAELGIKVKELPGYGSCPDEVLYPYAGLDAAATWMTADAQQQALRRGDRFGNECMTPFLRSMRALAALIEIHDVGIKIDRQQVDRLTASYMQVGQTLLEELRSKANWPAFNPRSHPQSVELLFGEKYNNKLDKEGNPVRLRPEGAISLALQPVLTTSGDVWTGAPTDRPSTNKEVCGLLAPQHPIAKLLQDCRFIDHILKSVLRRPSEDKIASDGSWAYDGGIGSFICDDGRVHSTFAPLQETGRSSSSRPPLQNIAKQREAVYQQIAGPMYVAPLRSIFTAEPGYVLVEADICSAELVCLAVAATDNLLLEHCRRSALPDNDPDYYDIHSNIAVMAFGLNCPPTKKGLASIGASRLRTAAKSVVYGGWYGRGLQAIARQCQQEGNQITEEETKQILDALFTTYPLSYTFMQKVRKRVTDPRWLRNCWGRVRRFPETDDPATISQYEREARSFVPQSMVADAMNVALYNLYYHPRRQELGYRIVSQIHDACLLEVPVKALDIVYHEVLPECMCRNVRLRACDLDGVPYPDRPEYNFDIDRGVFIRWGVPLTVDQCKSLGIDVSYAKKG